MTDHPLPNFNDIDYSKIESELTKLLTHNKNQIIQLLAQPRPYTWENLMQPLEELEDALHQFWSPIGHLNLVNDSEPLRTAYEACLPLLSAYSSEIGQNEDLYNAILFIQTSEGFNQLSQAQQKTIENYIRDFKLSGVALPADKKQLYKNICEKLSSLTNQFSNNILDATQAYSHLITNEKELAGIPEIDRQMAKQVAEQDNQAGWLFTLEFPSYYAIMQHADSRDLRQQFYEAYATRASDQGPHAGQFDNSTIMQEILTLRSQLAHLLGFDHYADYSIATKMVNSCESVLDFLNQLADASKQKAEKEYHALCEFAAKELNIPNLQVWDVAYASEKLRQKSYAISDEELRPYFPLPHVISGLFAIVKKLFQITIQPVTDADTWNEDVQVYSVHDQGNNIISYFYFDLYARRGKRGGAWMDDCQIRRRLANDGLQVPIAFVNCNFNPPVGDALALLTHNDVVTLFHEFGHSLQHMLTQMDVSEVSGINGIPWDAVEIASQFLENWAYDKQAIALICQHYKTNEKLPDDLYNKMWNARNFQSAMQMMRQLELSLFDFRLHMEFNPDQDNFIQFLIEDVRNNISIIPVPSYNRFANGFSHIFAGGYAAGYYSYKWAEVMACDAFSLFQQNGIFDTETATQFKNTFLSYGGSIEPMDVFIQFRGREPKVEALLNQTGITEYALNETE